MIRFAAALVLLVLAGLSPAHAQMVYELRIPTLAAAATVPNSLPLDEEFIPCIAASAPNTAFAVNGSGATLATVSAWGYQL
jgi:hypothetical protein